MLVASGQPVELDSHMARLAAGLGDLFGEPAPRGTREQLQGRAKEIDLGRLRLTVAPDSSGKLSTEIVAAELDPELVFPSWERAVTLRGVAAEGGLGALKWADRAFLERAEAAVPGRAVPLLLDAGDYVLEASRASVFAVIEGTVCTPPTNGRILPGIARRAAIEIAGEQEVEVREERLTVGDLIAADEVFVTGSVRGVEPVKAVDDARISPAGEIGERIAQALRQRWLG